MYIVIEGIDGSGKSTLVEKLIRKIGEDYNVISTSEPSTPYIIEAIDIVKCLNYTDEEYILSCLFSADRLILQEKIKSYIERGMVVISDRSKFSSFAYQEHVGYNYEVNCYMRNPDLIIYLDIDPELAAERYDGNDKFENIEFLAEVREKYNDRIKKIARSDLIKWETIEVDDLDENEVLEKAYDIVKKELEK
jgi:dTMP kinase